MNKFLTIGVIAVVIIIGAVILGGYKKPTQTATQPTPTQQEQNQQPVSEITVKATADGFVPQVLTIKAGTKVVWTNESGTVITVNSAPHPTHTDYPALNLGQFDSRASVSLVFDKSGTYKYHNHLNPTQFGSITVE